VARFERPADGAALTTRGAHVLLSPDDATVRRFRDPFGIDAEVVA
jgi:hypothetical protein